MAIFGDGRKVRVAKTGKRATKPDAGQGVLCMKSSTGREAGQKRTFH